MAKIEFEWDEEKERLNRSKHHVSFEEAATVFHDLLVATMPDPDHSEGEDRFVALGQSARGRVLVVSFTERYGRTRIISCRKAKPGERKAYEEDNF